MIKLENIEVTFGTNKVLQNFSLDIPLNGITCLSGPSGCGKTTLLRVIAGLQPCTGNISGVPEYKAFMFQEDRLIPWLNAENNIRFVLPRERLQEASDWLELVELKGENFKLPSQLSGGMCRRLAFARALAVGNELLILDEPFKGLDNALIEKFCSLIIKIAIPTIITTHSEKEIKLLGGRNIYLSGPPLTMVQ